MKPDYCVVNLDTYLNHKAYEKTLRRDNTEAVTSILGRTDVEGFKNVCVRVHPDTAENLDAVCKALDMPKTTFLRLALDQALAAAWERIDNITKDDADWHEEIQEEFGL